MRECYQIPKDWTQQKMKMLVLAEENKGSIPCYCDLNTPYSLYITAVTQYGMRGFKA